MQPDIEPHVRHNVFVSVMDGAFFGAGLGFASFVTVIPLFVNSLTDSATLVGLIASIHLIGWQFPQMLTAGWVSGLRRFKPFVIRVTLHERWPFVALALVALAIPTIGPGWALLLTYFFVTWQSMGGGFTATGWQSMLGKVIPLRLRGTLWGMQSAAGSLMSIIGATLAGLILVTVPYPANFAWCFFLAALVMAISWLFLNQTREPEHEPDDAPTRRLSWSRMQTILREQPNVRLFLIARSLSQFAWMAVAFYTVYGVQHFGINEAEASLMLALQTAVQMVANPLLGWVGDRFGNRKIFALGAAMLALSAAAAMLGNSVFWLYVAFALAGIGHVINWTVALAMTLELGEQRDRAYIIGLTNSLTAPATLFAPIIGGLLADTLGYSWTFGLAAAGGLATVYVLLVVMRPTRARRRLSRAAAG